jgi:phosphoribosylformylglycinamidine synthase subunit PurQ / glutaminase
MKAGVITFPGSNCDEDLSFILEKVCEFEVTRLWHKDKTTLSEFDLIALPGGFSYGDYLRCGAIASLSPIMECVKEFAESGKLVLGVCNGFQTLCEAGLLPGALAKNDLLKFVCKDVRMTVVLTNSPWTTSYQEKEEVLIPIAHGDGRYVVSDADYGTMLEKGQILFRYLENPNGSCHNIAGICNEKKNVFGMMPHPERATDLRSKNAAKFWQSILKTLEVTRQ